MLSRKSLTLSVACILICIIASCTHDAEPETPVADGGYPANIAKILVTRCATAGCHDQASYTNASGLLLDTWDHLFNGDDFGATVVPYWPQYSPLLYFVNTDHTLGPVLTPTMPYAASAPLLTKDEYNTLATWVTNGAPDKNGNIPFASAAATRQKIYALCNDNGIDLVAVIDAQRKVIMRYIKVGTDDANNESGHDMVASDDGTTCYESFVGGRALQKMDMQNDVSLGTANLGALGWALLCLNSDNTRILVSNWTDDGTISVAAVNTSTLAIDNAHSYGGMIHPHGIAANKTFDTFFVTASQGNCIYKCTDPSNPPVKISLDGAPPVENSTTDALGKTQYPHAIWISPDYSEYFVTCQNTNDVRVMDAYADTLKAIIPVGAYPQEIEVSGNPLTPYIFVTCRQDSNAMTPKGCIGSVYVINYQNYKVKKIIYGDFREPHGITVDNQNNLLYVFSLNIDGPPQHHSVNNNRDGWYTLIDINTLAPYDNRRYELKANPYEGVTRFEK